MILYPAIDLKDGQCVRVVHGDFATATVFNEDPADPALKVPHMGWNSLEGVTSQPVLAGLREGAPVYFTHSFAMFPEDSADVAAYVDHGGPFPAAVARGNLAGVQFHPEKSQSAGLKLLSDFLEWRP